MAAYEINISKYDTARPYEVVATFRSFNKVVGRYATLGQAYRRSRELNNVYGEG